MALDRIVIATRNAGKVKEFARLFEPMGIAVTSVADYPDLPEVEETGDTFAANALLKAEAIAALLNVPVLADDSGLCVDALDGEPGVYSARYAGEGAGDAANNAKLLRELALEAGAAQAGSEAGEAGADGPETPGAADRQERAEAAIEAAAAGDGGQPPAYGTGRFVCALALVDPLEGKTLQVEGECEGLILREPRGEAGFGYDPLFYVPEYGKTLAELPIDEKNRISHRARALERLVRLMQG